MSSDSISYTNIAKINGGITKTFLVLLLYCKALPSVFHNRNLGLKTFDKFTTSLRKKYDNLSHYVADVNLDLLGDQGPFCDLFHYVLELFPCR